MKRALFLIVALLTGLSAWAANEDVTPFKGAADAHPTLDEEDRIWAEGVEGEKGLIKSGDVYPDPAVSAYLQMVLDRLFPEFHGKIRVKVINDSDLNAFCMPQGAIFFNMGLLARLGNEAQLATILAHEGTHFTNRHSFLSQRSAKSLSGLALFAGLLGGSGGSLLGSLAAVSSMSGFSQDLEREADRGGYERMAKAGYDVHESVKAFQLLADEVKLLDIKQPYFFASHPRLEERIQSFNELIAKYDGNKGETDEARFSEQTRGVRIAWLKGQIAEGKPKSIIHVLSNPEMLKRYPTYAPYYLGEAYRLRAEEGDDDKAVAAWNQAVQAAPDFAPSYRSLGLHAMKKQAWAEARDDLNHYLTLSPDAGDAGYIRDYLEIINGKLKP